jgi:hypothetical protein
MMFSKLTKLGLLVIAGMVIFPIPALAWGLGVTPARLNFQTSLGGVAKQTLGVINTSEAEASFKVYVEEESEWFTITPAEFTLLPQQSEDVEIAVATPNNTPGKHNFTICVVSLSPNSGLSIGAGVKVPVAVDIKGLSSATTGIIVIIVIAGVIAGVLIIRKRRQHRG